MKLKLPYMFRTLKILIFFLLITPSVFSQALMQIPSQSTTYTGNTRGFWFQSPVDFMMVGVRVPTDASTDDQSIAVMRFNSGPPPTYATTTNDFTLLALFQDVAGSAVLSVNIPVYAGDYIGILGSRGTTATNSYGAGNFVSSILGETVTLSRMGMQYPLETTSPQDIWQENANISRVEMYYTTLIIDDFPYCDQFENGDGNFEVSGTFPSWEHGVPNNTFISAANSPSNAWVTNLTGDHNNNELSFVQSPEFDLTSLVDPMIRFQVNHELQSGSDGVSFQVSNDSGLVWSTLGSATSPSPWYNSSTISGLNSLNSNDGWTGTSSSWMDMRHSLLSYSNDTSILFRFVMGSNGSTTNEGFGFDDIIVAESNDIALTELLYQDSTCGSSAEVVKAVICNKSIEEKYGFSVSLDTNGTTNSYFYGDTLGVCQCDTFDLTSINTSQGGYWTLIASVVNSGDVNSANDVIGGTMTAFAIPGGTLLSGGGTYCQGDTAELEFEFTGAGPWDLVFSNGSVNFNLPNVPSPYYASTYLGGTFHIVSLINAAGCAADTGTLSGVEVVTFVPNPTPYLGIDSTVCEGYQLDAGTASSYIWSTGATTQQIAPFFSGNFAVTITDGNGCEGSDDINLIVNPNPTVVLADVDLCEGETYTFNAGSGFASYLWDDGSTGQTRVVSTQVTVIVTVTDANGCTDSDVGTITQIIPTPNPSISNAGGVSPVVLDAGPGFQTYQWSNGGQTQTISVTATGTYTCTVTDEFECTGSDKAIATIFPNSIGEIGTAKGVNVFPNPVKERLEVVFDDLNDLPYAIDLLDAQGRLVKRYANENAGSNITLSISSSVRPGRYILRFVGSKNVRDASILIVK